jgi:geranylgeranyl pyrophosphate synthase
MMQVKASMRQPLAADAPSDMITPVMNYVLDTEGKYLRPLLTLLTGAACAGGTLDARQTQALVECAAVSEMIHWATLLHDDVLDQAEQRRGRPTVRCQWDNRTAILSGDFLLAQASLKLAQLENPALVSIYAQVLADLCAGELEQAKLSYRLDTSWDDYFKKIRLKTASLFSVGCQAAGIILQRPKQDIASLVDFGMHLGVAFQVMDDLLDYTSTADKLGKPTFADLAEGQMNAPMLLALEADPCLPGLLAPWLTQAEATARAKRDPNTAEAPPLAARSTFHVQLLQILEASEALEKTVSLAHAHVTQAQRALAAALGENGLLVPSPYLRLLQAVGLACVQRER